MGHPKPDKTPEQQDDAVIAPFAEATRTPVTADLTRALPSVSPALVLQQRLQTTLAPSVAASEFNYSPRLVTGSVVTFCLAFWLAIYLVAAALT